MSTRINDGGQAFPTPENEYHERYSGMTLRDWFAGQALPTIILASLQGHCFHEKEGILGPEDYARAAYANADAMLAARKENAQ